MSTPPPAEPVAAEVEVAPRTPKPISFPASGEVRQVKAGTKLALLIDLLARPEGASIAELSEGLSRTGSPVDAARSEEHTSELQSRSDIVCRLLLEKKTSPRGTLHESE